MAHKFVKLLTGLKQTKPHLDNEFGCSAVDASNKIWTVVFQDVDQNRRGLVRPDTFLMVHNAIVTQRMIRATGDSRVGVHFTFVYM
jgi:hypothetical protein